MQAAKHKIRRLLAVENEKQASGASELGVPGVPRQEPQPHWPRVASHTAVFLGTTKQVDHVVDHYVIPRTSVLSASVLKRDGKSGADTRILGARDAANQGVNWATTVFLALKAGKLEPGELWGATEWWERAKAFQEMEWRVYAIPASATEAWRPGEHGQEIFEDEWASGKYAEIYWKPGLYQFSAHSGSDGNWTLEMCGERGGVPASRPAEDVLRAMHALIGALDERLQ